MRRTPRLQLGISNLVYFVVSFMSSTSFYNRSVKLFFTIDINLMIHLFDFQRIHRIECLSNAKWSSSFDLCKYKGKCGKIRPHTGIVATSCDSDFVGATCKPSCNKRGRNNYDLVVKVSLFRNSRILFVILMGKISSAAWSNHLVLSLNDDHPV